MQVHHICFDQKLIERQTEKKLKQLFIYFEDKNTNKIVNRVADAYKSQIGLCLGIVYSWHVHS